jgi:hypothetical protein
MYTFSVGPIGVIVATIASVAIGTIWFSPRVFGNKKLERTHYIYLAIGSAITAYVLAVLLKHLLILPELTQALRIGFFMWLGFVVPALLNHYIRHTELSSWMQYIITASFELVAILASAVILFFDLVRHL